MNIIEFIRARLVDDEQIARDASERLAADWTRGLYEDYPGQYRSTVESDYDEFAQVYDEDAAEHIARHDPARTLRDVKALRGILESIEALDAALSGGEHHGLTSYTYGALEDLARVWREHPDHGRWATE